VRLTLVNGDGRVVGRRSPMALDNAPSLPRGLGEASPTPEGSIH